METQIILSTYEIDTLTKQLKELERAINAGFELQHSWNETMHKRSVMITELAEQQGIERKKFMRLRLRIEK